MYMGDLPVFKYVHRMCARCSQKSKGSTGCSATEPGSSTRATSVLTHRAISSAPKMHISPLITSFSFCLIPAHVPVIPVARELSLLVHWVFLAHSLTLSFNSLSSRTPSQVGVSSSSLFPSLCPYHSYLESLVHGADWKLSVGGQQLLHHSSCFQCPVVNEPSQ